MKKLYKILVFLMSRSPIYILSYFSYCYDEKQKNMKIIQKIIIWKEKIFSWNINIIKGKFIVFIVIVLLLFGGIIFLHNKVKGAKIEKLEIEKIDILAIDRQLSYIGTFVLPLIAAFQKVSILWMLFYEFLIFLIISKNMDDYYKLIYGFLYKQYLVTIAGNIKIVVFSNELKQISKLELPKNILFKAVDISEDKTGEYIYFYNSVEDK